jgi:hypothetical protein
MPIRLMHGSLGTLSIHSQRRLDTTRVFVTSRLHLLFHLVDKQLNSCSDKMAAVSVRSSPGPSDGPNSSRIDMPSASSGPSTAQAQQQPRPPFGQAFGGMSGPSGSGSGGAGSGQTIPVRPASPVKPDGAGQQVKPVAVARNDRPIDMRVCPFDQNRLMKVFASWISVLRYSLGGRGRC